jgi:hypothetical protein
VAELKTKPTKVSATSLVKTLTDKQKREDSFALIKLMQEVAKSEPTMWGSSIIGFGSYHYKYASGHEGDMCLVGFSPRKDKLTLYIIGCSEQDPELLKKLGKYRLKGSCVHVKRLDDVHLPTLKRVIQQSVKRLRETYK